MKTTFFALAMSTLTACGTASTNKAASVTKDAPAVADLAGNKYCRVVITDGLFGQPKGEFEHCISFSQNRRVTDNSSALGGTPPRDW